MNLRPLALVAAALHVAACGSPPKPLPGGPPPEYEPPRTFDAGLPAPPSEPPDKAAEPPAMPAEPPAAPTAPPP